MKNVCVDAPSGLSRAMTRVAKALKAHAPSNIKCTNQADADLVVLHVVGYEDTVAAVERLKARHKAYAILQYCLRTTQKPDVADWMPLWEDAHFTYSYYDLNRLATEDGFPVVPRFFRASLGVDSNVFRRRTVHKSYVAAMSGYVAASECLNEVVTAAERVNARVFQLGPRLHGMPMHVVDARLGISDADLSRYYSASDYVTGLRRTEGHELPAAEGLCCGARPVLFDQPHYRDWFGQHAVYIPEGSNEGVVESLVKVFSEDPGPISDAEIEEARSRFHWPTFADKVWAHV